MKDDHKTKKQLIDELTELRLQNAALKETESAEKYRSLVENIKDVIYELDSQGVVLYISPAIRDMLGFDSTEIIGKNFTELAHKDDLSRLEEWFSELRKGEESPSEYRVSDKSGQLRWAQTKTRPIMVDGVFKGARGILIDITEQRKIVEALRESEERYRLTFENMVDVIYVIDADLNILNVSPSVQKILGYKPQDLIGRPVSDLASILTAESFEQAITNMGLIFKGETIPATLYRFIAKDGTIRYGEVNGSPVMRDDKIVGVISVARDITERKQADEALRKSEEKYRWVLNNMVDVITVMDMNLRFTYVSPSIIRMRGYTAEEAVAQTLEQVMTPESLQISAKVFEEELTLEASGTADPDRIRIVECEQYRKDGSIVWMENHLSFMRDAAKKPVGIISVSHDITGRKLAESKIKDYADNLEAMVEERTRELNRALYDTGQARDRIDGILKSVSDGLIVTDLYNRVLLMNRAAEDLLGVRLSEVINRPIDFAIEDKTLRERISTTLNKKKGGYQFDFEKPGDDPSPPRIIQGRTSMIEDKTGEHVGIITIMHDVTYEREIDRMKSEFISTAAHELRTPLTSIQGFSELLATRDNMTVEERKECLSYINAQSVNLANIINDLLDISRIESGKGFSLNKAPCSITELIRKTVPYFQLQSTKHRFDSILPDEPIEVMADIDKLRQVLENILGNAVKYSPNGGAIRITSDVVADHCRVSIADEGIGMTPEQLEKVFDKFYRADASNTAIPGTGLGMNIVKHLVEAHGGEVRVESKHGSGTTVSFTLPMQINKRNKKKEPHE